MCGGEGKRTLAAAGERETGEEGGGGGEVRKEGAVAHLPPRLVAPPFLCEPLPFAPLLRQTDPCEGRVSTFMLTTFMGALLYRAPIFPPPSLSAFPSASPSLCPGRSS